MSGHAFDSRSIKSDHDQDNFPVSMWTKEWFDYAFTSPVSGESYAIPADLRRASERICTAYALRGVCDPMYVANVIAISIGRGDGQSNFKENS